MVTTIYAHSCHYGIICLDLKNSILVLFAGGANAVSQSQAQKIIKSLKGLDKQLQPDEQPLLDIPGIWDNGKEKRSEAGDVVLTNQRVFGFYYRSFPREYLFLDAIPLASIKRVTLRQKSFEPLFRELSISDGERTVYVRSSRAKIEELYRALRSAIEEHAPTASEAFEQPQTTEERREAPSYERQEVSAKFDTSPLAITLLFAGGILLEVIGVILWSFTGSPQAGLSLCFAGFIAVITAIFVQRQRAR
jgi:hypothetical protein